MLLFHGWNDEISSSDLELDSSPKQEELVPVPDEKLDDEFNTKVEKSNKGES